MQYTHRKGRNGESQAVQTRTEYTPMTRGGQTPERGVPGGAERNKALHDATSAAGGTRRGGGDITRHGTGGNGGGGGKCPPKRPTGHEHRMGTEELSGSGEENGETGKYAAAGAESAAAAAAAAAAVQQQA